MIKSLLTLSLLLFSTPAFLQEKVAPKPAFDFLIGFKHARDFTIRFDQNEAFFTLQSPNEEIAVIAFVKKQKGKWSKPEIAGFTGKYRDIEPFLTPDGLKLYFSSNRPLNGSGSEAKDYDIWYVERKNLDGKWSAPIRLPEPVNTVHNEFYPSLAQNGNLYFTSDATTDISKDDIYFSAWDGKNFSTPIALGEEINSNGYEFNAYISPDENLLIYTIYAAKDGLGSGDLYISRKDATGNWSPAKNLGAGINSKHMDYCPFLDVKTNTLYFTSKRSSVSPKNFKSLKDFEKVANQYENGLSRIYQVPFGEWMKK